MKKKEILKKIYSVYGFVFPKTATKILFKKYMGYVCDLKNPKTVREKMQYLKLYVYRNNPLVTQCVDKYAVRNYIEQCGLNNILVPLLGVWDDANEIDFEALPDKFVLKCNHGSGTNVICRNKCELNKEEAKCKLNNWLKHKFGMQRVELIYNNIVPRIIAEEYIETENGTSPIDYKIFCSYGTPKYILVASNRDKDVKFDYFDTDWNWIPVREKGYGNAGGNNIKKPAALADLLKYAALLSKPFPLVRIDFYYEFKKIYFGEITFLDGGGYTPYEPVEYDKILGDYFKEDIKQGIKAC